MNKLLVIMRNILPIFIFLFAANAAATSCWKYLGEDEYVRAYMDSDVVFRGEAVYTQQTLIKMKGSEPRIINVSSMFEGVEPIKGNAPETVYVKSSGACTCAYEFEPGVRYVMFAVKSKDDSYFVRSCNYVFLESTWDENKESLLKND